MPFITYAAGEIGSLINPGMTSFLQYAASVFYSNFHCRNGPRVFIYRQHKD